jgi:hypothetical protein
MSTARKEPSTHTTDAASAARWEELARAVEAETASKRAAALQRVETEIRAEARRAVESDVERLRDAARANLEALHVRQEAELLSARGNSRRSQRRTALVGTALAVLSIGCVVVFGRGLWTVSEDPRDDWARVEQAARDTRRASDELAAINDELSRRPTPPAGVTESEPELSTPAAPEPQARVNRPRRPTPAPAPSGCVGDPNDPLNGQLGC